MRTNDGQILLTYTCGSSLRVGHLDQFEIILGAYYNWLLLPWGKLVVRHGVRTEALRYHGKFRMEQSPQLMMI